MRPKWDSGSSEALCSSKSIQNPSAKAAYRRSSGGVNGAARNGEMVLSHDFDRGVRAELSGNQLRVRVVFLELGKVDLQSPIQLDIGKTKPALGIFSQIA